MPSSKKTPALVLPQAKTIADFEREIQAQTPRQSILDATSLGIWSICEQAGALAGLWKQHRILLQDLDTAQVTVALGELLGAIAQTAHAIGIPLETVAQQQVARGQAALPAPARPRKAPLATEPRNQSAPPVAKAEMTAIRDEGNGPVIASGKKRGRPRKTEAAVHLVVPAPSVAAPTAPQRTKRSAPIQPTLLSDAAPAAMPRLQRAASEGKPARERTPRVTKPVITG